MLKHTRKSIKMFFDPSYVDEETICSVGLSTDTKEEINKLASDLQCIGDTEESVTVLLLRKALRPFTNNEIPEEDLKQLWKELQEVKLGGKWGEFEEEVVKLLKREIGRIHNTLVEAFIDRLSKDAKEKLSDVTHGEEKRSLASMPKYAIKKILALSSWQFHKLEQEFLKSSDEIKTPGQISFFKKVILRPYSDDELVEYYLNCAVKLQIRKPVQEELEKYSPPSQASWSRALHLVSFWKLVEEKVKQSQIDKSHEVKFLGEIKEAAVEEQSRLETKYKYDKTGKEVPFIEQRNHGQTGESEDSEDPEDSGKSEEGLDAIDSMATSIDFKDIEKMTEKDLRVRLQEYLPTINDQELNKLPLEKLRQLAKRLTEG